MTNQAVPSIMMSGYHLLLTLDTLYGLFQPVEGIDAEKAGGAIAKHLGVDLDDGFAGIAYMHGQLDPDARLRRLLRTATTEGLHKITFDARDMLKDVREGLYHGTLELLVRLFCAVADGELTEADFKEVE